jgi:hypothetical protein
MKQTSPTLSQILEDVQSAIVQLPTVEVGQEIYISSTAAIEAAATILYPDGIQTEEVYQHVNEVTEQVCAKLGFGEEHFLSPPTVPFNARGNYRKRLPPVDSGIVREVLGEIKPTALTMPVEAISQTSVLMRIAYKCWEKNFNQLTPEHQSYLKGHCDLIAGELGWKFLDTGLRDRRWAGGQAAYIRPLQPDYAEMRRSLAEYLHHGRPVPTQSVRLNGLAAAFEYGVNRDPEGFIPAGKWADILSDLGYEPKPRDDGYYHPRPLVLPNNASNTMRSAVATIEPVSTRSGPVLLLDDVLAVALKAVDVDLDKERVKPGVMEQLISNGPIGRALILLGYEPDYYHARAWEFDPPREDNGAQVFHRSAQFEPGSKLITAASGFPVRSPVLVRDNATLVYMELLGPRQVVHANWAALRNGGRNQWVAGASLSILKSDRMVTLKQSLPIGWDHWCLIHRQTSFEHLIPSEPFYILDDGESAVPPAFYPLLSKSLALPLLPEWTEYLWIAGRQRRIITPLDEHCHGRGAWRVTADEDKWWEIVSSGLAQSQMSF